MRARHLKKRSSSDLTCHCHRLPGPDGERACLAFCAVGHGADGAAAGATGPVGNLKGAVAVIATPEECKLKDY